MKKKSVGRRRIVTVERASRSFKQAGRMLYFLSPEIMECWKEVHS